MLAARRQPSGCLPADRPTHKPPLPQPPLSRRPQSVNAPLKRATKMSAEPAARSWAGPVSLSFLVALLCTLLVGIHCHQSPRDYELRPWLVWQGGAAAQGSAVRPGLRGCSTAFSGGEGGGPSPSALACRDQCHLRAAQPAPTRPGSLTVCCLPAPRRARAAGRGSCCPWWKLPRPATR